ncbi:phage tail protein [Shinella sp. G-2]|uniref:phage tail protein n=1 Tax=Shinella sp. G-2 TaxID=3133141 RepID=UPI003D0146C0
MIRVLLFLFLFLTLSSSAEAAPIGAAIAAVSSWWAGASVFLKFGVMLAINVGSGLLEQYRAKKAARKANEQSRGVTLQMQMGDTLSRSYLIGTHPTAGRRNYAGSWGEDGKTPNAFLVDVREISFLPSHAGPTGLQELRIADRYVTILWAEPDPEGRGYPVLEYRVNGRDNFWVHYLDGTQTAAHPYLLAKFAAAERPWKPTMIGRGCQAVIVTLRRNDEVFRSGLPEMLFRPAPMRLYNLCKDSSKGGSGTHRWEDPSTWEPSDILPVMAYNVARGLYYNGRWVHGGRNFAHHRLPASSWMAAITEAERDMGGGRRQFRGGLEVRVEESGLSILEKFRAGCAGRYAEVGGSLKMLVGAPAAAVWTMTDETVVVTRDQDFEPFPSTKRRVNTIRPTYPEPATGWRPKEGKARSAAALVERDGGEELAIDVNLEVVSDAAQVDAISATMIDEAQRWRTHRQVLPPSARPLEPNDVIAYTSDRNSYGNKKFIISQIRRLTGCLWEVTYQELDPSDYDPKPGYLPPVTGPTGPIPTPVQVLAGFTAVKSSINDSAGNARRPAILVGCPPDLDDVTAIHIQIRVKTTLALVFDNAASAPYPKPGSGGAYTWLLSGAWCVPAGGYLVRGRLVPGSNRPTEWCADIEVIVDDIRLGDQDVFLPGVIEEVQERLKGLHEWLGTGTRDLIESSRKNVLLDIDADVGRYAQVQMVRQEVTATAQGVSAKATAELLAATGAGSAIAQSLTALNAAVFDQTSGLKATAAALVATTTRVTTAEGQISTLSQNLVDLTTTVGSKASAAALDLLQTQVTQQGNTLTATANSLTSLTTTVGKFSANGMFRISVEATPAGSRSRIGLSAAADGVEGSSAAALFLEAIAGGKSIAVVEADAFYVRNGTGREPVFAVSGGIVRMILAYIGTIRSGRLLSLNSKVDFDLDNGRLIFKS